MQFKLIHVLSPWVQRLKKPVSQKQKRRLSSEGVVIKSVDSNGRVRVRAPEIRYIKET